MSLAGWPLLRSLAWSSGRRSDGQRADWYSRAPYDWTTTGETISARTWNRRADVDEGQRQNRKLLPEDGAQPKFAPAFADAGDRPRTAEYAGGGRSRLDSSRISDNLYAFDTDTGKIIWQKHWDYEAPAGRGGGGGGGGQPLDHAPRILRPGGSSKHAGDWSTRRAGRRPSTSSPATAWLHPRCAAGRITGKSYMFHLQEGMEPQPRRQRAVDGRTPCAGENIAVRLDDPQHKM